MFLIDADDKELNKDGDKTESKELEKKDGDKEGSKSDEDSESKEEATKDGGCKQNRYR